MHLFSLLSLGCLLDRWMEMGAEREDVVSGTREDGKDQDDEVQVTSVAFFSLKKLRKKEGKKIKKIEIKVRQGYKMWHK